VRGGAGDRRREIQNPVRLFQEKEGFLILKVSSGLIPKNRRITGKLKDSF
jgi:hypothetical protein